MTRDQFIAEHVRVCTAQRRKKYDPKKKSDALHTLAYSRRMCAKSLWRQMQQRKAAR